MNLFDLPCNGVYLISLKKNLFKNNKGQFCPN